MNKQFLFHHKEILYTKRNIKSDYCNVIESNKRFNKNIFLVIAVFVDVERKGNKKML